MVSVKFEKGSLEFQMFADYYRIAQKYWNIKQNDDDEWVHLVDDIRAFHEKYIDISLAKRLAGALVNDLEERSRKEAEK